MHCSRIRTRKRNAKKSIKTVKIWNPALFGIRNPGPGIRNPQRGIQNPRMSWIPLHGAKSRLGELGLQSMHDGAGDCFFRSLSHQLYGNSNHLLHGFQAVADALNVTIQILESNQGFAPLTTVYPVQERNTSSTI